MFSLISVNYRFVHDAQAHMTFCGLKRKILFHTQNSKHFIAFIKLFCNKDTRYFTLLIATLGNTTQLN